MPPQSKIDKIELIELYVNKKLSARAIAPIIGMSKSAICDQIKKHGISRSNLEATIRDECGRFIKPNQKLPWPEWKGEKNPNWKNGIGTYPEVAFEHYGKFCKICGSTKNIEVHHVDKDRTNNDLKNLLPVCKSCHCKIHDQILNIKHMRKKLNKLK